MYTKLSLVGAAALGASVALASCPLDVEIGAIEGHHVDVTITNTANQALTVFKGNTVLSGHPTKNVAVIDTTGSEIPFTGRFVTYDRRTLAHDLMETMPAGSKITKTINVANTHDLSGIDAANVLAIQDFYYQFQNGTANRVFDLAYCRGVSQDVKINPVQEHVKRDHLSFGKETNIQKRAVTYTGCTAARTTTLKTAFTDAVAMCKAAITAASSSSDYYTTWYKSTSVLSTVKKIYTDVANVQTTGPTVHCTDFDNGCSQSVIAYTEPSTNQMVICPSGGFWGFPMEATTCADSDYDQAGTVLHESTHLYGTDDYAYGEADSVKLTAAQASENADTYELYAASVRLGGCKKKRDIADY